MPDLDDAMLAIKIDEIDREAHPERVHSFAGHDPQSFAAFEMVTTKQPFAASVPFPRQLEMISEFPASRYVDDAPVARRHALTRSKESEKKATRCHD